MYQCACVIPSQVSLSAMIVIHMVDHQEVPLLWQLIRINFWWLVCTEVEQELIAS